MAQIKKINTDKAGTTPNPHLHIHLDESSYSYSFKPSESTQKSTKKIAISPQAIHTYIKQDIRTTSITTAALICANLLLYFLVTFKVIPLTFFGY